MAAVIALASVEPRATTHDKTLLTNCSGRKASVTGVRPKCLTFTTLITLSLFLAVVLMGQTTLSFLALHVIELEALSYHLNGRKAGGFSSTHDSQLWKWHNKLTPRLQEGAFSYAQ